MIKEYNIIPIKNRFSSNPCEIKIEDGEILAAGAIVSNRPSCDCSQINHFTIKQIFPEPGSLP